MSFWIASFNGHQFLRLLQRRLTSSKEELRFQRLPSKFSDSWQRQVHSLGREIQEKQGTIHTVFHQHPPRLCTPTYAPVNSGAKSFHPYEQRKPAPSASPLGPPQEERQMTRLKIAY